MKEELTAKCICDHCKEIFAWENGAEVMTRDGKVFSGHEMCMHVLYADFKESGRI